MTTNTKNYYPKTNVQKLLNIKQTNLKVQHLFAFFSTFYSWPLGLHYRILLFFAGNT